MGRTDVLDVLELVKGLETCWKHYKEASEPHGDDDMWYSKAKCTFMQLCSQVRLIGCNYWCRVWGNCGGVGLYGFDDFHVDVVTKDAETLSVVGVDEEGEVYVLVDDAFRKLDLFDLMSGSLYELGGRLLVAMRRMES